ncbi:MAG: exodeoxyribonuclease VII small subunit [Lachnospiraceae bacterium]|nr:exodeoxyribonuclease VII small subunit [Lachnospiraceae bacterium]
MADKGKKEEKAFPLEQAFEQIEDVIEKLQDNEITLEDAFSEYEHGMRLLKQCNEAIDRVEKQVLKISESGELCEFE